MWRITEIINSLLFKKNILNLRFKSFRFYFNLFLQGIVQAIEAKHETKVENLKGRIKQLENENEFSLYPNPNNGIFTINSKEVLHKIEVTDIAGQTLFSESTSEKTHQLHLNNFTQGIYFIKVNYVNGLSTTKKVIVNP